MAKVAEKYTIMVECSFSASHALPGCPPCDRVHGHTWKVRAKWAFYELDEAGMGADFSRLRAHLGKEIEQIYDHTHLNDVAPFNRIKPTAENLAKEFFRALKKGLNFRSQGKLEQVEVWEGPENAVSYEELP
jgi:6-pyruvoyltetrahydropterin/6-carboxytetrahydropterin synthase